MSSSLQRKQQRASKKKGTEDFLIAQTPSWSFFENGRQALLGYHVKDDDESNLGTSSQDGHEHENSCCFADTDLAVSSRSSKATTVAACFLKDFLAGRPHVLPSRVSSILDKQLILYKIRFSKTWKYCALYPAAASMFITFSKNLWTSLLHTLAAAIFFVDIYIGNQLEHVETTTHPFDTQHHLKLPLLVFLLIFVAQNWAMFFLGKEEREYSQTISSLFKPIVLFYLSRHARHILESLGRASKTLLRVVIVELFLILSFAAMASRLYYSDENFAKLSTSWLSLFQLSTTVVSPSIWMSIYNESRVNAWFFVVFVVICVFYLHSLILALVFQSFIQSASEVHKRSLNEQEQTLLLAYEALQSVDPQNSEVETRLVRSMLQKVRPHYSTLKMNVLMEIFDPNMNNQTVDYDTFRKQIRLSLKSSIREVRNTPLCDAAIQTCSIAIALFNFLYVLLLTSVFHEAQIDRGIVALGIAITLAGLVELVMRRFNPLKMRYFPLSGSNALFDMLAFAGVGVSMVGMCLFLGGHDQGGNIVLIGRTIDMFRMMRFFSVVRDVVERSQQILPSLAGPGILIFTSVHVFVYFGMALWGGAIDVYELSLNEDIEPFYYLCNFNSYGEGLVTVFNVMVINDWHEISRVFLYADRCNHSYIVYPYFILVVLIGVVILLNVVTAFFVETFVVKLNKEDLDTTKKPGNQRRGDFSIHFTSSSIRSQMLNFQSLWSQPFGESQRDLQPSMSHSSDSGDIIEFDVFERGGFNEIMNSLGSGGDDNSSSFAKNIRDVLELVGMERTGFLVICGQNNDRFSTSRFSVLVSSFLTEEERDGVTTEFVQKLKASNTPGKRLLQKFIHSQDPTMVLELLGLEVPARKIMLIVAKLERPGL